MVREEIQPVSTGVPVGPVKTSMPWGRIDLDWEAITRYDAFILEAATPVGWPIERVRGHIVVESQGDPKARQENGSNGWSYGLMQVVPYGVGWEGWHATVKEKAGLPKNASRERVIEALYDPRVNILCGVHVLETFYQQHGTLDKASSAFFLGNPDWRGRDTVNGNEGVAYRDSLNGLIAEQKAFAPPDPIAIIVGREAYNDDYGFKSPAAGPYYEYFEGHGGSRNEHTGIDVPGPWDAPLATPLPGIVTCAGTNVGAGSWNTSCAAFTSIRGGVGRVEILLDAGPSLILGHCARSLVRVGQRVAAGQAVATIGDYNGPHVHIETRIWQNGTYRIVDPRATLIAAMKGAPAPTPQPAPPDRIDIPQPDQFEKWWVVQAIEGGVKVMQHTGSDAPEVRKPLARGETFEAPYVVMGNDGKPWWVSTGKARVPFAGTRILEGPPLGETVPAPEPEPHDHGPLIDRVEEARKTVARVERELRELITALGES